MIQKFNTNNNSIFKSDFENFVTKNSAIFCAFARRYTSDQYEIEDLVQESLFELWHSKENINSPINYVFTNIKNKALNNIRSKKKITYNAEINPENYHTNDFIGDIINVEASKMIADAISQLPEQSRNVMMLLMQGMKGEEVAKELGISVSSVKTLKTSSLKKLKLTLPKNLYILLYLMR